MSKFDQGPPPGLSRQCHVAHAADADLLAAWAVMTKEAKEDSYDRFLEEQDTLLLYCRIYNQLSHLQRILHSMLRERLAVETQR